METESLGQWGVWEFIELLGEGSFGRVYKAKRQLFGKTNYSAIKVIKIPQNENLVNIERSSGASDKAIKEYFMEIVQEWQSEIEMLESLKSAPNVMVVEDYEIIEHPDKIQWDIYIRMELLIPFTKRMQTGSFYTSDALKLGIDLCRALEYCSVRNIMHRDIKPENIFVSSFGDYKLGDFGIARQLEKTNSSLSKKGTYMYMAPEVYRGEQYDSTVDIYSLGLVLYKLFNNNRLPFSLQNKEIMSFSEREESLGKRVRGDKLEPPLHASEEMSNVILKACAFYPAERYKNPTEMIQDLQRITISPEMNQELISITKVESDMTVGIFSDRSKTQSTTKTENTTEARDDLTQGIFQSMGRTNERTQPQTEEHSLEPALIVIPPTPIEIKAVEIVKEQQLVEMVSVETVKEQQSVEVQPIEKVNEPLPVEVQPVETVKEPLPVNVDSDKIANPVIESEPVISKPIDYEKSHNLTASMPIKPPLQSEIKRSRKGIAWIAAFVVLLLVGAMVITQGFGLFTPSNQEVEIPNVVLMKQTDAVIQLEKLGLKVSIIEKGILNKPVGTVLEQSIKAQNKVIKGSPIQLTVAKEVEKITIPRVIGMDVGSAKIQLENLGLLVTIKQVINDNRALGEVLFQSFNFDLKVTKGSTIVLEIAAHSEEVTVPNLIGKTEDQAKDILVNEKLNYKIIYVTDDNQTAGLVFKQSISVDSSVKIGTIIDLSVYSKSPQITVPAFSGKTLTTYKTEAENLGFKISSKESFSDTVASGQIISVSPGVGTKANKGSTINVVVSKGKSIVTVKVPAGVGGSYTTFQTNAINAGLVISKTDKCSNTVANGSIISMNPAEGTTVNQGSTVNVVVSSGLCPWSAWVTSLPAGVSTATHDIESKTQYQFRDKETTTASTSTLAGWIKYDETFAWSAWSDWSKTVVSATASREINTRVDQEVASYTMSTNYYRYKTSTGTLSWRWSATPNSTYRNHAISIGGDWGENYNRYEVIPSRLVAYEDGYKISGDSAIPSNMTSSRWYIKSTNYVNVTMYQYRDKTITYHFYRWKDWSAWQDAVVTSTANKEVQTRIVYRYRQK
jgi:beta-lactam-binding protein with PASTA domain/serine/threonine protein kinase